MCDEVYHFENGHIQHINDGRQSYSYMTINMYSCNPGKYKHVLKMSSRFPTRSDTYRAVQTTEDGQRLDINEERNLNFVLSIFSFMY